MGAEPNTSLLLRHPLAGATAHRPGLPVRRIGRTFRRIARFAHVWSEIWRQWHSNEKCIRALVELDDDDLHHLSEAGRRLRREARRQLRPH
jgi:hypothetical protein